MNWNHITRQMSSKLVTKRMSRIENRPACPRWPHGHRRRQFPTTNRRTLLEECRSADAGDPLSYAQCNYNLERQNNYSGTAPNQMRVASGPARRTTNSRTRREARAVRGAAGGALQVAPLRSLERACRWSREFRRPARPTLSAHRARALRRGMRAHSARSLAPAFTRDT